jgi:hypothetical protein
VILLAGCSSGHSAAARPSPTVTRTEIVGTRTVPPSVGTYRPAPAASVKPLAPSSHPRRGEREKACPYIRSSQDQSRVSVADIEGDRVYRTTELTGDRPVGCRFYFWAPPYEAVADIRPTTFPTATAAYNAMVLTARTGTELITERGFVKGVDGICFRTRFFGPDGARDWAFVFAKGKVLVIVHTQRTDTSRNALYLAQAIAGKF